MMKKNVLIIIVNEKKLEIYNVSIYKLFNVFKIITLWNHIRILSNLIIIYLS